MQELKQSLTPAERKLDSRLAVALLERRKQSLTAPLPRLQTGVSVSPSGTTEVDVRATRVDADLVSRLRKAGARIRDASKAEDSVRATVPLSALREVASWSDVEKVEVAVGAMTARMTAPWAAPATPQSKEAEAAPA